MQQRSCEKEGMGTHQPPLLPGWMVLVRISHVLLLLGSVWWIPTQRRERRRPIRAALSRRPAVPIWSRVTAVL